MRFQRYVNLARRVGRSFGGGDATDRTAPDDGGDQGSLDGNAEVDFRPVDRHEAYGLDWRTLGARRRAGRSEAERFAHRPAQLSPGGKDARTLHVALKW